MAKEKSDIELPDAPPAPTPAERVESWKDIAAYLQRDVRTVQRWEKTEALPVYRHMHDKLGTVYAYKAELDAWWNNRRPKLEQEPEPVAPAWPRRAVWLGVAGALAVVAALGVLLWQSQHPPLAFGERDWVLITSFENRTGEPVFDGTLEYALERELSNSRFVNVVPRERINDTLRLMKKPLDTRVDAAVGREISLRDGGIRALLTGRVEKLDNTYVLSAVLVDPSNGSSVASFSEEAAGQKEVVPALRRLTSRLRGALGEELAALEQSQQTLEKVTTPSLRALQLYSEAMALLNQSQWATAAELLERALAEDPEFASAHILLAHCYVNINQRNDAAPHFQRAFELAETTADRERYFILGSYYDRFEEKVDKAVDAYELLIRLYPDHYWGVNNLALTYQQLSRHEEAERLTVRLAELRPNDFLSNMLAAWVLIGQKQTEAQARLYLERARTLSASGVGSVPPAQLAWVELFPAFEFWLQNDAPQANRVADNLSDRIKAGGTAGQREHDFFHFLATFYFSLGKLQAAEDLYRRMTAPGFGPAGIALAAFTRGDTVALRKHLTSVNPKTYPSPTAAMLFVRASLLSQAEILALEVEKRNNRPTSNFARRELALARGQTAQAIPLFEEARRLSQRGDVVTVFFLASESLATAHERQGDLQRAIQVLEEASLKRRQVYLSFAMIGHYWLTTQNHLGQLYRKAGRDAEARRIEAELLKLLALADADHPLLVELKRRQDLAAQEPRQ